MEITGTEKSLLKQALEGLDYAMLLCDGMGRVAIANQAAAAILAQSDGVSLRAQFLCFEDSRLRNRFRTILQSARLADEQQAMLIPRPSGAPSYQMVLKRIEGPFDGEFGEQASLWSAMISDPVKQSQRRINTIARLYELTPAEVRLSDYLGSGATLQEIAEQIGVKITTIRTQLNSVFAKTGVHRQADLVRLFSSVPAMR